MKTCCRCETAKLLSDFNKDKSTKDGLEPRCRACSAAKKLQERLDAVHFQSHPKQTKTWIRNVLHTWKDEPPLEARIQLSEQLYELLLQRPNCPYTGTPLIPTVDCNLDHKIPLSRGGQKWEINNLQFVSRQYNMAKNNMTDDEFLSFCQLIVKRLASQKH